MIYMNESIMVCSGKTHGCRVPQSLLLSSLGPGCRSLLTELRLHWHHEADYNSTEIPCPTYTHRRMSKKYSRCYLVT